MVEVMKIMSTSFKSSHACTSALSAPDAAAGHRRPMPLPDTHGHVWVSFLWGHCSFLLGPGSPKVLFVPSKRLFPQSSVSSGGSMEGLITISSKRAYAIPRFAALRALPPWQVTADTYIHRDTQTQFWLSLCGVSGSWWAQGLFEPMIKGLRDKTISTYSQTLNG